MASERRPSAVLIVNPNAGRVSDATRAEVVAALGARFDLEAHSTTARDTGIALAAAAAEAGAELVIAFGGDGHVNEVANGVAGTASSLGIVPGGTMNVFARSLGIPTDPFAAIDHLIDALRRPERRVPLGVMDGRYFTFAAGCGFDAEAASRVERYVPSKRRLGEAFFYWSALRVLVGTHRHRSPWITLKGDFGEERVAMVVASNTGPYAYLLGRPIHLAPRVRLEGGIDLFALRRMKIEELPIYALGCVLAGDLTRLPGALYVHDQTWFELAGDRPFERHVDGEPLPPAMHARFSVAPGVLKVRA